VVITPATTGFDRARDALRHGLAVVLPTDTVYGVAVEPSRPGATARLFEVKQRPTDVALPMLAADPDQAFQLATDVPEVARRLAARFWPGGLTLVVARRPGLGLDLGGADDVTIGIRVPDHQLVRRLASDVGPLATTSANLHGRPTPESAAEVAAELGDAVGLVLDGGGCAGLPSTVVACTGSGARVRRVGRIPSEAIAEIAG
jgi:L-threonylcarbamoyladenylate synthase